MQFLIVLYDQSGQVVSTCAYSPPRNVFPKADAVAEREYGFTRAGNTPYYTSTQQPDKIMQIMTYANLSELYVAMNAITAVSIFQNAAEQVRRLAHPLAATHGV